ncbi:hypothetical protein FRB90_008464 [Tulasnella sp. 427]|nr:hypothetical protein FRB90_008464 [Tulasnella sp. 427]
MSKLKSKSKTQKENLKKYPRLEYKYPAVEDVCAILVQSKEPMPQSSAAVGEGTEFCDHDHPIDPVKAEKWKHDLYRHRHSTTLKRKIRELGDEEVGPAEETIEQRRLRLTLQATSDRQYIEGKGEKAKRLKEEQKARNRALNAPKPRGRKPIPTKEEVWLAEGMEVAWVEKGVAEGSKEEAKQILMSQLQDSRGALDVIEREKREAAKQEPFKPKKSGKERRAE